MVNIKFTNITKQCCFEFKCWLTNYRSNIPKENSISTSFARFQLLVIRAIWSKLICSFHLTCYKIRHRHIWKTRSYYNFIPKRINSFFLRKSFEI
ncbi:MAG: phage integrase SAM-like domain-containing protein, partial [Brevinematia bacterium]